MPADIGRRIRAALALAGHTSKSLEPLLGSGYKDRTIRKLMDDADDSRVVEHKDLVLLTHHLGVPMEFFTAPNLWAGWKHAPTADAKVDAILAQVEVNARVLEAVVRALRSQGADVPDEIAAEVSATRRGFERANEALDAAHRELRADPPSTETPVAGR
jgi:hypothetical protein